jgi:hypothetical protein
VFSTFFEIQFRSSWKLLINSFFHGACRFSQNVRDGTSGISV